jgi:Kef-type K+ transport system membrane component KefB
MRAIMGVCILLFFAKLVGIIFQKMHIPESIGFVFAGILLGPSMLGTLHFGNISLIELNDHVRIFARLGYILLLFLVGLNITFTNFRIKASYVILSLLGAVSVMGFGITLYGYLNVDLLTILVVSSCLITSKTPTMPVSAKQSSEMKVTANVVALDNLNGVLMLAIIMSFVEANRSFSLIDTSSLVIRAVLFCLVLILITVMIVPRLVTTMGVWSIYLGRFGGVVEVLVTAMCFFYAALAGASGLSPVVGAIICGIAIAASNILVRVKDYTEKVGFLFAPIFFAIVGADIDVSSIDLLIVAKGVIVMIIILGLAVTFGSILPSLLLFRKWQYTHLLGLTRFSVGTVSLVIAGVSLVNSVISANVYLEMIILTLILVVAVPSIANKYFGDSEWT